MIDEATFTAETTALLPTLYRIGRSILHSDADAQDAVQQALEKAWANRAHVRTATFRAWLTRIAVNECRNIQRYRMRVTPVAEMKENGDYTPPDLDLAQALASLDEKLRLPLLLKYMEGYTEQEVAKTLGLSIPAVKNRLYRARRALEKMLSTEVTFT